MSLSTEVRSRIDSLVASDEVVLFMKGSRTFPQCGFSATVVQILNTMVSNYTTVNILTDPELRQGIKVYSDWPTIPQLYVKGEFVGGADIIRDMYESGELQTMLGADKAPPAPKITVTAAAAKVIKEAVADSDDGDYVHLAVDASFQHALEIGPKSDRAIAVEAGEVTLLVEPMSARRLDGVTIDYVEGAQQTGFKIDNPNQPPEVQELTPAELKAKLDAGEIKELVDVRSPEEREQAVIPGSRLLDDEAMRHLTQIDINTPVAFYCHHGPRSLAAAEHFRDRGFRNVYNLTGGIDAWSLQVDTTIPRY